MYKSEKIVIPFSVTEIEEEGDYGDLAYLDGTFYGCDSLTIYGYKGSYAETYAKDNNILFVDMNAISDEDENSGNDNNGQQPEQNSGQKPQTTPSQPSVQPSVPFIPSDNTDVPEATTPAINTQEGDDNKQAIFKITGNSAGNFTVEYVKPVVKTAKVTIPFAVTIQGTSYKVTSIANNAFKNNKKIKKIVIPSTIEKIGKQAFFNCKKLKNIVIKTKKLKNSSVGKKAFKGISVKATIKVPKAKKNVYKKLLKSKGLSRQVRIK